MLFGIASVQFRGLYEARRLVYINARFAVTMDVNAMVRLLYVYEFWSLLLSFQKIMSARFVSNGCEDI